MHQAVYRSRRTSADDNGEARPSLPQLLTLILRELASLASLAVAISAGLIAASHWLP